MSVELFRQRLSRSRVLPNDIKWMQKNMEFVFGLVGAVPFPRMNRVWPRTQWERRIYANTSITACPLPSSVT